MNLIGNLELWLEELCRRFPVILAAMKAGDLGDEDEEYIFLRLDKVCPWEGMEMKTDFSFREKVLLSEIVGKKDRLSNRAEQLSDQAKRG